MPGAYQTALYHSRRSIELNPAQIKLKTKLLMLNHVPEKVVSNDEARIIAHEVLQAYPENALAISTLEYIEGKTITDDEKQELQIINNLKSFITAGEFLKTRALYPQLSLTKIDDALIDLIIPSCAIFPAYAYACFLVNKLKTEKAHLFAVSILQFLSSKPGTLVSSLFHLRKVQELEPASIRAKQLLIDLNRRQTKIVSDQEALTLAQEIVQIKPDDPWAREVLQKTLKSFIISGGFLQSGILYRLLLPERLQDLLCSLATDESNITAYVFICFLLTKKERAACLDSAVAVVTLFCHIKGTYQAALYHARRAVEQAPRTIAFQEGLLLLNRFPEKVISDQEAYNLAKAILSVKPKSRLAKEVFAQSKK